VALIVTGSTTETLEERTNEALGKISTWMKENDLRLAAKKPNV